MKIQLTKADIEAAVNSHIADMGLPIEGKFVTIEFSVKRAKGGLLADVDITDEAPEPSKGKEAQPARPRKPRGPNKPKATTDGVAGTVGGAIAAHSGGTVTSEVAISDAQAAASVDKAVSGPALAAAKQEGAAEAAASTGEAVTQVAVDPVPAASTTAPATTTSLFN